MQLTGELEIIQLQARAAGPVDEMQSKVCFSGLESVVLSIQTENLHQHVKNEFKRPENKNGSQRGSSPLKIYLNGFHKV